MHALDILGAPAITSRSATRAVVLVLHGGVPTSTDPVDKRSGSWRRAAALGRAIAPSLAGTGATTYGLRYAVRGWNADGAAPAPLADARWALDRISANHPGVPVVLLGHSMGGRVALHVADHDSVIGVVALAPWWPGDEPVAALAGRHVIAAHGERDRITSARATRELLRRAQPIAASTEYVSMGLLGHYMLTHIRRWNRAARDGVLAVLEQSGND